MVRVFTFVALAHFFAITAWAETLSPDVRYQLRIEYSKSEIFEGEPFQCNFVLYSIYDTVEVEVAKFPEFRGFWSENLTLRQGPIPLMPFAVNSPWKKSVIGSYLATPMLKKEDATIEPMKVVIRPPFGAETLNPEITLQSTGPYLRINPLPPIPPGDQSKIFFGGVGVFHFTPDTNVVPFRTNEPTSFRISLQGEGNFQEMNQIDLPLPQGVELLSRRSFTQGAGQYTSKSFEYTFAVRREDGFSVDPQQLLFFNPHRAKYETLTIPSIRFEKLPPIQANELDHEPDVEIGEPEDAWSVAWNLDRTWTFWLLQLFPTVAFTYLVVARLRRLFKRGQRLSRRLIHLHQLEKIESLHQTGSLDECLRQAEELAFELLKERLKMVGRHLTRTEAIRIASETLPEAMVHSIRRVFEARDAYAFSRQKTRPENPAELLSSVRRLFQKAA